MMGDEARERSALLYSILGYLGPSTYETRSTKLGPESTKAEATQFEDSDVTARSLGVHGIVTAIALTVFVVSCSKLHTDHPAQSNNPGMTSGVAVLERGPSCDTCEVVLEELGVLGRADDSLPIGSGSFLLVSSGGRCIVGPTDRDGEVLVFDGCRGAPRVFGRTGQGPGEIGSVRSMAPWRGDSILLFSYGRMEVLSDATGSGRTVTFDPAIQGASIATVLDDSLVIVNNDRLTKPQFSLIRSDGRTGPTFGAPVRQDIRADPSLHAMVLGSSPQPHRFWAGATFYRYHLELWSSTGEQVLAIDRSSSWFPPYDSTALARFWSASAAVARPLPYLRSVRETADHLIWAAFAVAAKDWKPDSVVPLSQRDRNGEVRSGPRSRMEHYDGVLDVLDGNTKELLISVRTDEMWAGIVNDTLLYARRETPDGVPQLVLYRIRLRR